jgi:UDP-N-acetylmuramoylalanine--D-glutamate ligase
MTAREHGKEVYSEFSFAAKYCQKPIIAVCGTYGRTTVAAMIAYAMRLDKKNVFVGGTSDEPFINFHMLPNKDEIDYVIVEMSPYQIQGLDAFRPTMAIYPNLEEDKIPTRYKSISEFLESNLKVAKLLTATDYLVVNFDRLSSNFAFRDMRAQTYWYSRKSFATLGVMNEVQGTHFHEKRIHNNVHFHSEFCVSKMRIIGQENRENLLAAITACKILNISETAIQTTIEKFPGIANNLEFIIEKNGVKFYNDSKSETMDQFAKSLGSFKEKAIVIAGGKDQELTYAAYSGIVGEKVRILVLVGECKEALNRDLGDFAQTFIVGSFDEGVLIAYQKSRTGDSIVLCPGNPSTDVFRDHVEKGAYYKKLVYQL